MSNDEKHIKFLMRGERPEGMSFEEFKIKRKIVQKFLKRRNGVQSKNY